MFLLNFLFISVVFDTETKNFTASGDGELTNTTILKETGNQPELIESILITGEIVISENCFEICTSFGLYIAMVYDNVSLF